MRVLLLSVALWTALAHSAPWQRKNGRAIYITTNDADNGVAAIPIATDGTLSAGKVTSTSGKGSNAIDGTTKLPAAPDALLAQSSLTIAGKHIFAVNAGSNTLSMLQISQSDPTDLKLMGQPAALPGEFPNTVAVSAKNHLACVGTTGSKAGISCTNFSPHGLGKMDALRPFDLGQTTPPVGPTNTVSQTFFSNDESILFTTVKGDPTVNETGFLSMFPVQKPQAGGVAATLSEMGSQSSPAGTAVLFGSKPIPGTSNIFATDASFGAAVLSVDGKAGTSAVVGKGTIVGQKATCWVAISPATNTAFVSDVGVNHVVEMSLKDASIINTFDLSANGDPGLIDMAAAGNFLYALSPGNGTIGPAITVMDVSGGPGTAKQVQHFELAAMGVTKNAQGMAVLL